MASKKKSIFEASFDVLADNYHSVRPGYPALLFKDIKSQCNIDRNSRLLEIGAGSGIATIELVKMGCHIVAVEPGAHLAAIIKGQIGKFKNVQIFEETFENFRAVDKFDVILAFTAFHWLNQKDKYKQVSDLLNDSGNLVLVWNSFFQSDSPTTVEINHTYQELLPDICPKESTTVKVNKDVLSKLKRREQEVFANSLLYPIFLRKYLSVYNYDSKTYPKLLNTFPRIIETEESRRSEFLKRVSEVVKRHDKISVPVLTTLIVCRKRNHFLETISNP